MIGMSVVTIRHMKIFVAVYQAGNITHAAEQLHMTQPAVSRSIQELEHYYGVRLFERINRRLSVTESGKRLYEQALHIVDSFDTLEKGLQNWDEFGVLRIGATITLGTELMPHLIAQFQRQHPHLRVQVKISNGASLVQELLHNKLDIALVEGGLSEESLVMEPFARDKLIMIAAPDDPLLEKPDLQLRDLENCRFLLRENGSVGRGYVNHVFAAHGIPLTPLWESASTRAIVKAVSLGLGISFLPEQLIREYIDAGIIVTKRIEDESFERSNYVVWHKHKYLSRSAKEFIALVKSGQFTHSDRD